MIDVQVSAVAGAGYVISCEILTELPGLLLLGVGVEVTVGV